MTVHVLNHSASPSSAMTDPFGRTISYLRVSVTDRCDLRCFYCMSEDMTFLPKAEILSLEELDRLCSTFVSLGVRKLRLTGGEPLVRRNIPTLVEKLAAIPGLKDIGLTTNGMLLAPMARALRDASQWLENYRQFWEAQFRRLDALLQEMQSGGRKKRGRRAGRKAVSSPGFQPGSE